MTYRIVTLSPSFSKHEHTDVPLETILRNLREQWGVLSPAATFVIFAPGDRLVAVLMRDPKWPELAITVRPDGRCHHHLVIDDVGEDGAYQGTEIVDIDGDVFNLVYGSEANGHLTREERSA